MKKAVKIFLVNNKKQILLQLRDNKKGILYPNYWDLFGGTVEVGETYLNAIKREINEEIDSEITNLSILASVNHWVGRKLFKVIIFKGLINKKDSEINLTEGQEVRYFSFNQINNIKFTKFRRFLFKNKHLIFKKL